MKPIKIIFLTVLLLTACSNTSQKKLAPDDVFKKELIDIYSLYEDNTKILIEDGSEENIDKVLEELTKDISCKDFSLKKGNVTTGLVRVFNQYASVVKLPVNISFSADEENVKKFLMEVIDLDSRIIINNVEIDELEEQFSVSLDMSLCISESAEQNNFETSKLNIEALESKKTEQSKIVLRDSDMLLILRPYNSDSATLSVGFTKDFSGESYFYNDINDVTDLIIEFSLDNGIYYCKYLSSDGFSMISEMSLKKEDIVFDILSCSKATKSDLVGVNLNIINKTDSKVSVKVFDDKSKRVNINYSGSVEVIK